MADIHVLIFEKVIELIYGVYDPLLLSSEEQDNYVKVFKDRLIRWKQDESFRKFIGPLQPAHIFSKMAKVPIDIVQKIADDLGVSLPFEVDITEFSIDKIPENKAKELWNSLDGQTEEYLLDILAEIDNNETGNLPFVFIDLSNDENIEKEIPTNAMSAINYLENIIAKIKTGEVYSMTMVTLLINGNASLWIPKNFKEDQLKEIYDPLIEIMKNNGPMTDRN